MLGSLWLPLGRLGAPWAVLWRSLGHPGGTLGHLQDIVESRTSFSEQVGRISAACAQLLASRNSPPDPEDPAEVAYGPQLATPLPRAGGQDAVS